MFQYWWLMPVLVACIYWLCISGGKHALRNVCVPVLVAYASIGGLYILVVYFRGKACLEECVCSSIGGLCQYWWLVYTGCVFQGESMHCGMCVFH